MVVNLVISLPKDRIYTVYVWYWPTLEMYDSQVTHMTYESRT